jgi:hypothetical protein
MEIKFGEDRRQLEIVPILDGDGFKIVNIPVPDDEKSDYDDDDQGTSQVSQYHQMYNVYAWL